MLATLMIGSVQPLLCWFPLALPCHGSAAYHLGTIERGVATMTKQPTLTKADLIEEVLKVTELPRKESETIVETIFHSIIEAIQKGEKIEIRGFGSLRTRQRQRPA